MKPISYLSLKSKLAFGIAFLSLITLFAACKKSSPVEEEPVGEIKIKAVNTVIGSADQDFFINDVLVSTSAIPYGHSTDYTTGVSGANTARFNDAGSTIINAIGGATIPMNEYATVMYHKAPDGVNVASIIRDDMTAPATGKARVRFLNINNFLNNSIAIGVVGGSSLIPSHPYGRLSDYYTVDPGAKFTFLGLGMTNATTLDANITAGKIYTIWVDGETSAMLTGHAILQN